MSSNPKRKPILRVVHSNRGSESKPQNVSFSTSPSTPAQASTSTPNAKPGTNTGSGTDAPISPLTKQALARHNAHLPPDKRGWRRFERTRTEGPTPWDEEEEREWKERNINSSVVIRVEEEGVQDDTNGEGHKEGASRLARLGLTSLTPFPVDSEGEAGAEARADVISKRKTRPEMPMVSMPSSKRRKIIPEVAELEVETEESRTPGRKEELAKARKEAQQLEAKKKRERKNERERELEKRLEWEKRRKVENTEQEKEREKQLKLERERREEVDRQEKERQKQLDLEKERECETQIELVVVHEKERERELERIAKPQRVLEPQHQAHSQARPTTATPTSVAQLTMTFPPELEERIAQRVLEALRPALESIERHAAERESQRQKEREEEGRRVVQLEAQHKEEHETAKVRDEARDKAAADMHRALGILAERMEYTRRDVGGVLRVLGVEATPNAGPDGESSVEGTSSPNNTSFVAIGRNRRRLARGAHDVDAGAGTNSGVEVIDVDKAESQTRSHGGAEVKNVLDRLTGLEMDIQECLERLRDPMADFNVEVQALPVQPP